MKLDHIGDLITALRRLRMHFPTARIHLLGSGAARAFLAGEDCVDELIEFEFFHARSGLGQKELTDEDLRALGERLVPPKAATAVPALRINAECNCSGPADIAVGPVRYRDDRTGQIVERAFRPSAARATAAIPARFQVEPGQPITQNAPNFPVTPDHPSTIQVPMRTNQTSAGSGYVALVFLDAAGKELERLRLPFEPAERPIGTLTTDAQGRFSLLPDAATLRASVGFRAEFAGDARYRTASATLR